MEFVSSGNNIALKSTQALISDHDQDKIKVNSPNSLRFPNNPDKDPFFKPSAMDVKDEDRDGKTVDLPKKRPRLTRNTRSSKKPDCPGWFILEGIWGVMRFVSHNLSRDDLKVYLETTLVLYALLMALCVVVPYAFTYQNVVDADRRYLENVVLGRNISDAELDSYYSQGALVADGDYPSGMFYKFASFLQSSQRGFTGTSPAYGKWALCHDASGWGFGLTCTLPSHRLFWSFSACLIQLIATTLIEMVIYVALLFLDPLEDVETHKAFIALALPGLLGMWAVGILGIMNYLHLVRVSMQILIPRWNVEAIFQEFYEGMFFTIFWCIFGYLLIAIAIALIIHWIHKDLPPLTYYDDICVDQLGHDMEKVSAVVDDPQILNNFLKDENISHIQDRAQIIQGLRYKRELQRRRKIQAKAKKQGAVSRNQKALFDAMLTVEDLICVINEPILIDGYLKSARIEPPGERLKVYLELKLIAQERSRERGVRNHHHHTGTFLNLQAQTQALKTDHKGAASIPSASPLGDAVGTSGKGEASVEFSAHDSLSASVGASAGRGDDTKVIVRERKKSGPLLRV